MYFPPIEVSGEIRPLQCIHPESLPSRTGLGFQVLLDSPNLLSNTGRLGRPRFWAVLHGVRAYALGFSWTNHGLKGGRKDTARASEKNLFSVAPSRHVSGVRSVKKQLKAPYLLGIVTYGRSVGNCKLSMPPIISLINQWL